MRKGLAFILAATMALTAACGSAPKESASGSGSGSADAKKPIKIGVTIPQTGGDVDAGRLMKNGVELAVETVNKAGGVNGRDIQLVIQDDQSTNPGSVAALQKILEDKEVVAVVSTVRSTQIAAQVPTINEMQVPVAIGGTNFGLTQGQSQWIFRFRPHDGMSAKAMVKFVVEDLKKSKIAVLHSTDAFGNGGRDMVANSLKELNMTLTTDQGFNTGEKDFTGVISALKQSGADVIISYIAASTDLGILAKQMKQQGLSLPWVGSPSITGQDALRLAGDALYGTYGVADFNKEANPKAKAFAEAFKAKYGQDPDFYSSWPYDAITVLAEIMKKTPDLKPETLRNAILATKGLEGVEGTYNFDKNGDGLDSYHILQNDNNTFKLVKTIHANGGK
ncbi:MAG TPA: ABC transporter substrate-binding protein [Symbiobacteriaceae bacterium]|nr:ABC transporter substrate-binding protein [Symbiobacteriaceae bacterium]